MGFRVLLMCYALAGLVSFAKADGIFEWGQEPLDDGARCDVNAVRRANREQLHLLLEELTNTTFFRLFRVGLDGECPMTASLGIGLDEQSSQCSVASADNSGHCSIDNSDQNKDLPPWMLHKQPVDRTISNKERTSVASDLSCETPDFWFDMCHGLVGEDESKGWINLQLNPERHTGYNGSKVWQAIYKQACFADATYAENADKQEEGNCGHEQRVLQRLISGLHASINTHISLFYHPPITKKDEWLPNPARFMETVGLHPERIRNLNFAFVVLLRALRKAAPVLSTFSYAVSGDSVEDLRTAALVRRLLETHLMSSCSQVFDSFDESLMFQSVSSGEIKRAFKEAFLAISRTLDCIKCQKCRLHGKLQLTGIGLALKILFLSEKVIRETPVSQIARREEIVALFNTIYKFSHAINAVDILTEMHLNNENARENPPPLATIPVENEAPVIAETEALAEAHKDAASMTTTVESVAKAYFAHAIDEEEERLLLDVATGSDESHIKEVLKALARGYGTADPVRFALHTRRLILQKLRSDTPSTKTIMVIGSGLAGSSATLTLLDALSSKPHTRVVLVEKQHFMGGNSVYASSGMNAVDAKARSQGDSAEAFAQDVARSSGKGHSFAFDPLVVALTRDAEEALLWVRNRVQVDFSQLGKLGGHSFPRTHRPEKGQAGAELVFAIHKLLKNYTEQGRLHIAKGERFVDFETQSNGLLEVRTDHQVFPNISALILATGGFAANKTLLPEPFRTFGTTNGPFTTGDAVSALARKGALFRDMDRIQLHPTAFASNDKESQQPLCAEILRGVGGILLNKEGKRFVDELGTRAHVSGKMVDSREADFTILLSAEQASQAEHFRSVYLKRGLLTEMHSLKDVSQFINCQEAVLENTLKRYAESGAAGLDEFGKRSFPQAASLLNSTLYYAGRVQPAVHYCMGGVATDEWGRVLDTDLHSLRRVYAAGEVSGGLHGNNRLGGNGMTEGLVFGRRAARAVLKDIFEYSVADHRSVVEPRASGDTVLTKRDGNELKLITKEELARHNSANDCWVSLYGKVYDFTDFVNEHPGGSKAIIDVAGGDGTDVYDEIHTSAFLDDFQPIGKLV